MERSSLGHDNHTQATINAIGKELADDGKHRLTATTQHHPTPANTISPLTGGSSGGNSTAVIVIVVVVVLLVIGVVAYCFCVKGKKGILGLSRKSKRSEYRPTSEKSIAECKKAAVFS